MGQNWPTHNSGPWTTTSFFCNYYSATKFMRIASMNATLTLSARGWTFDVRF